MTLKFYAVYDAKVKAYMNPFLMRTKGEALREWDEAVNKKDSSFNKHPEDYTLFEIGEYDSSLGLISAHTVVEPVGKAIEYIRTDN